MPLLEGKNAVVYGAGGAIGGAVARAFAREGARVFLAGRTAAKLGEVARDIAAAGGTAETAQVDALDEQVVARHADAVAARAGGIDIALNAVGIFHVQGTPFADLSLEDYAHPITAYARTHFITAKAVARHMARQRAGVILTLSTPGSRMPGVGYLGFGVACAAIEGLTRLLAGELAPAGIRVVCLRPHAIPEATAMGSHSRDVFRPVAERAGTTVEGMLAGAAGETLLKRLPALAEVASTAAFLASDQAAGYNGPVMKPVIRDESLVLALSRALLVLRVTLGLFLLQWGVEKFVVPQSNVGIWSHFYGLSIPQVLGYAFGAAELAIAVCLFLGMFRTVAYGAALGLHAVSVLVSWRELIHPWADPVNHLFIASVPVLGGLIALFLLRHWDRPAIET